ncbi:MAG: iron-sulfur cluster assembly scaffold protein [Candidatus Portnoybacteria bacterium RBG_19FT_COMBO_36_7]|uniref:Iron-sulfur cluster assembly scaffold protein n=1 Tax=Candidatus Portnoybacteria bacterium RBG_19FT_COMBO_36_7 TaxID=1801992 RepID=A0A1G2F7T7_9BACT|nr:MAG: iron-sulfur cluster assembly scaffold protein [Candidatus Portnoybacteria bacterium RBG_19FT_COMBO_36_7]
MYSKKVLEQFLHPKNMGSIKDADGVGKIGNIVCGDRMTLYIKVKSKNEKGKTVETINDIKFESFGCAAAIATSSMITELAKGKTLREALELNRETVAKELGGLPPIKMHCSNMAAQALHKAIEDYRNKLKSKNEK